MTWLTIGLPGKSNALAIAERLGIASEIIAGARSSIEPDQLRVDALLGELERSSMEVFSEVLENVGSADRASRESSLAVCAKEEACPTRRLGPWTGRLLL